MMLAALIAIPLLAGLIGWPLARWDERVPRVLAMAAMLADLAIGGYIWAKAGPPVDHVAAISESGCHGYVVCSRATNPTPVRAVARMGETPVPLSNQPPIDPTGGTWLAVFQQPWIPQLGISFHLRIDGLSLLLVLLTALLGLLSVAVSWRPIRYRVGFFHLNLMLILAGVLGVFLALDLFLFYFFWELMLIPMYFLIAIWGHENRHYAAVKFFLFTQLSGLLMLLAIIALALIHARGSGVFTFDYLHLLGTPLSTLMGTWLMLGFLAAFAVKLPVVPLHTWLPDAHTESPTAGSVILAGLLLKTGAYGLIRFVLPLFPLASMNFAPYAMALGVAGILYGAAMAFAQTDLKRLVAYTSVSHLGFVMLGVFAFSRLAMQGAVLQMICHGLSTGGLFILAGAIGDRLGTRDINRMGGLWKLAPRMGAVAMFLAMASLGLPGLGNFLAEFLVLLGSFGANATLTVIASAGLLLAMIYSLWLIYRIFHGPLPLDLKMPDLRLGELCVVGVLIVALVWLGLYPQPVLDTSEMTLAALGEYLAMPGEQSTQPVIVPVKVPLSLNMAMPTTAWACHPSLGGWP